MKSIQVRIPEYVADDIKAEAGALGLTVSSYLRILLMTIDRLTTYKDRLQHISTDELLAHLRDGDDE